MYVTRWYCRLLCLLSLLVASTPAYTANTAQQGFDETLLTQLRNPSLRQVLRSLYNKPLQLTRAEATDLLIASSSEPRLGKALTAQLLQSYQQQGIAYDAHRVMEQALQEASPAVIQYLLEHQVYDPHHLQGQVRYHFFSHCSLIHLLYIFFTEVPTYKISYFLPLQLERTWNLLGLARMGLGLVNFLFPTSLLVGLNRWIGVLRPNQISLALYLSKIGYALRLSSQIGIAPGYLFKALQTRRAAQDRAAIALLLLAHGADPNTGVLLVHSQQGLPEAFEALWQPKRYEITSALHVAAQEGMLEVVQALLAAGVPVNTLALQTRDTLHQVAPGSPSPAVLPVHYRAMSELYKREGTQELPQTPLQWAPQGSLTAQYLEAQGGQPYRREAAAS